MSDENPDDVVTPVDRPMPGEAEPSVRPLPPPVPEPAKVSAPALAPAPSGVAAPSKSEVIRAALELAAIAAVTLFVMTDRLETGTGLGIIGAIAGSWAFGSGALGGAARLFRGKAK